MSLRQPPRPRARRSRPEQRARPEGLEGAHINVLGLWSGPEFDSFVSVKSVWEQETGAIVDWEGTQDLPGTLAAHRQSGDPTDIAILPNLAVMQQLADDGNVIPLDSVLDMEQITQGLRAGMDRPGSHDGKLYGIFSKVTNKGAVWYSPKAFAAAGYRVPTTWDEMIKLADTIVADGHAPFSVVAPSGPASGWALTDWISEIVLRNCGPDLYDQWVAIQIPWTEACIKQSFEMFAKIVATKGYVLGGSERILSTGDDDGADPLYTDPPTAYLCYLASFAQAFIASRYPNLEPGTDYDFFRFPTINPEYDGAVTVGADVPVMVSDTPAARSFMAYLASARAQETWIKLGGFTSVNRSVSADAYPIRWREGWPRSSPGQGHSFQRRRHDARDAATGLVGGDARPRPGSEQGGLDPRQPDRHRQARPIGAMTMKLVASMMVSLDGVYQGPGGPDEDRRGGFERGGWTASHADAEMGPFLIELFERADALLLGRKTWEIWEPYWPNHDDNPFGHNINLLPKYVPSTTLKDPAWQNTHVITGDVEAAVRELKAKPGRELQVHGSGVLLRWLLERDLVDELNLRISPVIVGDGCGCSGARPDARLRAGRLVVDLERRDGPDLPTERSRHLRPRRLTVPTAMGRRRCIIRVDETTAGVRHGHRRRHRGGMLGPYVDHDGIGAAIRGRKLSRSARRRWSSAGRRSCAGVLRPEPARPVAPPPARVLGVRQGDRRLFRPGGCRRTTRVRLRHPDGTRDKQGNRFWNATDARCNFDRTTVDDVAYLSSVITEIRARWRSIQTFNGGGAFQSRLHVLSVGLSTSRPVAAIVSLAGETFADPADCKPSGPVSVAQVQGTADEVIHFDGGGPLTDVTKGYPGAESTAAAWAKNDGCNAKASALHAKLDVDADLADGTDPAETSIQEWSGCDGGATVQLWTIPNAGHSPALTPAFADAVIRFLDDHPKP